MSSINYYNSEELFRNLSMLYGIEGLRLTSSGLYSIYPKIFKDIFPISEENVKLFQVFSEVYIDHILCLDTLCEGEVLSLNIIIEKYIEGNELVHKLSYIFEETSHFWIEYRKLYGEYFSALIKEEEYKRNHNIEIDKKNYLDICKNKSSLSKLLVYGMALLSGELLEYKEIEVMLDNLNLYMQILDDFKDMKCDIENEYFNYYVYKIIEKKKMIDYEVIINELLNFSKVEFLEDMKNYLFKSNEIFQRYKKKIPLFEEVLKEQFKVIDLIENGIRI